MQTEFGSVAIEGHVMIVTIDRPAQRNALHAEASHELGAVFDAFERDPALGIAIVTGAGSEAFCTGADEATPPTDLDSDNPAFARRAPLPETGFAGLTARFNRRKPVIAAINGLALGGGFEAALACDIVIAAQTATFALTEPRQGLAALGGGIQRVVEELGPKRAHALLLTGRTIDAAEAERLGLVAEVVPVEALPAAARRWADEIAQCAPAAIAAIKAVVQSMDGHGVQHSMKDMAHLPEVRRLIAGTDGGRDALAGNPTPSRAHLV
jgi:enoyl-CoA hydratase/carnithine racemase